MPGDDVADRLEMLLVMRWLDAGADDEAEVVLSVSEAARELDLDEDRAGVMAVMAGLGELEDRRSATVAWPLGAAAGRAHVRLSDDLRADARRLFGRA